MTRYTLKMMNGTWGLCPDAQGAWVLYDDAKNMLEIGPNLRDVIVSFLDKMKGVEVQHAAAGIATIIKASIIEGTDNG